MKTIDFKCFGESLGTRVLGKKIREEIEFSIRSKELVVLNFNEVRSISHSFSDECFGKLLLNFEMSNIREFSTFKNVNSRISNTIVYTLKERANKLVTA